MRTKPTDTDTDAAIRAAYCDLAEAVVMQAIKDWCELCEGEKPTGITNFAALEDFFKHRADNFLAESDMDAKALYQGLLLRRQMTKDRRKEAK